MARPCLFKNRKFIRLIYVLEEPLPHVLGYLECMWTVGYENGEPFLGDEIDVELAAQWPGKQGQLAKALADCGFIDRVDGGYEIHDLFDHAPQYVQQRWQRELERRRNGEERRKAFAPRKRPLTAKWRSETAGGKADGDLDHLSSPKFTERCATVNLGATPAPAPLIPPLTPPPGGDSGDVTAEPTRNGKPKGRAPAPDEPAGFTAFMELYPVRARRGKALAAWQALSPDAALQAVILDAVRHQEASARWKATRWPEAGKWLGDKEWAAVDPDAEQRERRAKRNAERAAAGTPPAGWSNK